MSLLMGGMGGSVSDSGSTWEIMPSKIKQRESKEEIQTSYGDTTITEDEHFTTIDSNYVKTVKNKEI